jgi:hypothetical protein
MHTDPARTPGFHDGRQARGVGDCESLSLSRGCLKTAFIKPVDLSCRKQRIRLFILTCFGILSFCLVASVAVPAICPVNGGQRTRFCAGKFVANTATTARRGLHYGAITGPFEQTRCVYLRFGSIIWYFEARTPQEP